MLQMLVVTLREGAFLIVAIAIAYLRKTGRGGLVPAAWWGSGAATALSIVLGVARLVDIHRWPPRRWHRLALEIVNT